MTLSGKILFGEDRIRERVLEMARAIASDTPAGLMPARQFTCGTPSAVA